MEMNEANRASTEKKQQVLIAYHANCIDGFTSYWVTALEMERRGYEVDGLPMEYNEESYDELLAVLAGPKFYVCCDLYVVDFSLPASVLECLYKYKGLEVTILDHHKTAFQNYCPGLLKDFGPSSKWNGTVHGAKIVLDNNECGASLCWRVLTEASEQGQNMPKLIEYVKDYDLWRFELGDETKWINKWLRVRLRALHRWTQVAIWMNTPSDLVNILEQGRQLQITHDLKCETLAADAVSYKLGGLDCLAVSCPYAYTSDVGHLLAVRCGTFGVLYTVELAGNKVKVSLRSDGDVDVSQIAKLYGGGGHAGAAGFEVGFIPAMSPVECERIRGEDSEHY